jgi:hypothetical protein
MHNAGGEIPRISLPRTPLNKPLRRTHRGAGEVAFLELRQNSYVEGIAPRRGAYA